MRNVPQLRFNGFDGEWEATLLQNVADVRDGTHDSPEYVNEGYPLITSRNVSNGHLDFSDVSLISKEDYISINKRSKVDTGDIIMPMIGTIGNPIILNRDDFAIKNVALIKNNDNFSNEFLLNILKSKIFMKYMYRENAGGTQKFIALGVIRNFLFNRPEIKEQEKIGELFRKIDNLIEKQEAKVSKMEDFKKSMLQKMFPKKGEFVPEFRFEGFDENWTKGTLNDLGTVSMNRRIFKDQTSKNGDVPFYKIGTFGKEADSYISKELFNEYKSKYPYPTIGDLLISASGSIGKVIEYTGEDAYYQDSNIVWLKTNEKIKNIFLKQYYYTLNWRDLEGSTIKRLYNKDILRQKICYPDIEEQQKIGQFFKNLDSQIETEEKLLEAYKLMKKSLLQKMFV